MTRGLLGLGSNLGDRGALLRRAVDSLGAEVKAISDVFESDPVGGPEQGPYLNLVVELDTDRSPSELLDVCRGLEAAAGRIRSERWGPRTLDVDILWIDGVDLHTPELEVPHPRMFDRRFVMEPLGDVAPDLRPADWSERAAGHVRRVGALPRGRSLRVIGPGRVGRAVSAALGDRGWRVEPLLGRADPVVGAAHDVDVLLITAPDSAIAGIAEAVRPGPAVIGHLAGSLGLEALAPHPRTMALHPLASIPGGALGSRRLTAGNLFAVSGDPLAREIVADLGGTSFELADEDRVRYHAAACVASNHLVALLAQVERIAATAGLPLSAFMGLVDQTVDAVRQVGVESALTGPAARGDEVTIQRHLTQLDPAERPAYEAMADLARRVAQGRSGESR